MRPLPRPLQALVTWTAILPLVLLVSALAAPLTVGWPGALRTAAVITVVVPLAVFWVVPLLARFTQRLRGVPANVVAQSCPAPGVRGLLPDTARAACSSDVGGQSAGDGRVDDGKGLR